MTPLKIKVLRLLFGLTIITSCSEKAILSDRNFDNGNWLIVINNDKKTLFAINDEKVLKANPYGLLLTPTADCGGTTCDGFLYLYKDGELIAEQQFLTSGDLKESKNIKKAYRKAKQEWIFPRNKTEYKKQWDSLIRIKNVYPTRYHEQPENKDIICFYTYE